MRKLLKILLSGFAVILICAAQAQVRSVRTGPAIPPPPPTAPTSRTFLSQNRKFKLVLEEATLAPISASRKMPLNAAMVEERGNDVVTLWAASFEGEPVQYYSEGEVIVSDDGDFFVLMKMNGGDVSLFTKNSQRRLASSARFTGSNGLFLTPPENLIAADVLDGQKFIRIWLRNENAWEAFRVSDGAKISITPPIAAQWNDATREKVLDLMYADKRERLRRRVGDISAPLARLSRVGGGTNASALRGIHYEFITQQRKPEDRHWIEELAFGDNGANSRTGNGFSSTTYWPWFTGQYTFFESDYARLRGDWLLAIWDKKLTNGMRPIAGETDIDMPRFYLGKVSGRVRLPVPLNLYPTTKSTVLHVHLIKEGAKDSAEHLTGTIAPAAQSREVEVMQDVWFKFGTVLPGTYRLKAVWDRRAPFANPDTPGPGDYEGILSAPVVVTAGANISNLVVNCTNRAREGEAYYRADQWLADNWRSGKIARFTYAPDSEGRVDIVTRPAADWIIRTNSFDAKLGVEIATIGLRTAKNVPGEELQHGNELVIALRRTSEWSRQFLRSPELIVMDEHGCPYPAKAVRDGDLITYTFWNFPRSAATWRIIGNSQEDLSFHVPAATAFDVTVTNLVQTAPHYLPVQQTPAELNLGEVTMKIAFAGLDFRSPSVAATFFVDGKENPDWQITEARVVDVHGNFMGTREMCRAEQSAILIGRVGKGPRATKTLPFEIGLARDADPPATGSGQ